MKLGVTCQISLASTVSKTFDNKRDGLDWKVSSQLGDEADALDDALDEGLDKDGEVETERKLSHRADSGLT